MKIMVLTLAANLLAWAGAGQSACSFDTLPGVTWEFLGGPPAHATSFAQSGQRVFAATNYGLFFSDNLGGIWQLQEQTRGQAIESLYANDTVVLFQTVRTVSQGPYSIPAERRLDVFGSLNAGQTFVKWYDLDADHEYLWTQLAPYVWTGFTDLGGGFLYFDHGWPHLNYAPGLYPYENTRYFSGDYGKTWQSLSVTNQNTPGMLPPSPLNLRLSFCNDTLLGVKAITLPGGGSGTELNLYPHGSFGLNVIRDTLATVVVYHDCIYFNQTLYVFDVGSTLTTVRRFKNVLTDSLQIVPETDTLYFPQENLPPYDLWSQDTVLWFKFYGNRVYRASVQHPEVLTFAYKDLGNTYTGEAFAALPAGQFHTRPNSVTVFSNNGGATWTPAHHHLTASATGLGARCGRPVAGPFRPGPLYELAPDGHWTYLDSTWEKGLRWVAGEAFGRFFLNTATNSSYYTNACADPIDWSPAPFSSHWDLQLAATAGRAYAIQINCSGCMVQQTREGTFWKNAGFGSGGTLYLVGDTLLLLSNDQIRYSFDGGSQWQIRYFPPSRKADWIVLHNGRLVATKQTNGHLEWHELADWSEADSSDQWLETCNMANNSFAYAAFGDVVMKPEPISSADSVIFLHARGGLYLSRDGAHTWWRLPDLPFQNRFAIPHHTNGMMQVGAAEGAHDYAVLGHYLYAFTSEQGVWRTPWLPIAAQLPGSTPMSVTARQSQTMPGLFLAPNPATDEVWITLLPDLRRGTILLYDLYGRMVREIEFENSPRMLIDLRGMPPGTYTVTARTAGGATQSRLLVISRPGSK